MRRETSRIIICASNLGLEFKLIKRLCFGQKNRDETELDMKSKWTTTVFIYATIFNNVLI